MTFNANSKLAVQQMESSTDAERQIELRKRINVSKICSPAIESEEEEVQFDATGMKNFENRDNVNYQTQSNLSSSPQLNE